MSDIIFNEEKDFEEAVIKALIEHGWESDVIRYPSEEDLIQNWANILFNNNKQGTRLNDQPLTSGEMAQILDQVRNLQSPMALNEFINGRSISITRDNPNDPIHLGKEISLKIYDRQEIALGQSRYQIVQQPKSHWDDKKQLGGHVWHTTGSGKTMTSFKAAQLVAANHDADKVVFLVDRKELGIQSLKEYRSFATGTESVQATENTDVLISKLKSPDSDNTLIVTSIQKLSNIAREDVANIEADLKIIQRKRMVIIIDECHRSTFGDMLVDIKNTFKNALIFGFTGTPIQDLNAKKDSTTPTIFGDEIHRYTLGDGIRDKNVLGFDPYMVRIYDDADIREKVALSKAKAKDPEDAFSDPKKEKVYLKYMDSSQIKMYGELVNGKYVKGIEDFVPNEQYQTDEYVDGVIQDIKKKWTLYSRNRKFHAIFATSSIPEAVKYYRLMVKASSKDAGARITSIVEDYGISKYAPVIATLLKNPTLILPQ